MAQIYQHIPRARDQHVGSVDSGSGRVTAARFGPDQVIGRVDYASSEVFESRFGPDRRIGRATEDGKLYLSRLGPDEYIGRVEPDGKVYGHRRLAPDEYLGRVDGLQHPVEGAAALLFFFDQGADDATPEA